MVLPRQIGIHLEYLSCRFPSPGRNSTKDEDSNMHEALLTMRNLKLGSAQWTLGRMYYGFVPWPQIWDRNDA